MTTKEKNEIISQIIVLLGRLIDCDDPATEDASKADAVMPTTAAVAQNSVPDPRMEMLSIKECTDLVKGLTSNTIRKLIKRGELPCVRAGYGKNGKILVSKANLIALYTHQNNNK